MCDFEDTDIISRYTQQQAVEDGILVEVLRWNGIPVMATSHIRDEFGLGELFGIWHKFCAWKDHVEPTLPEEDSKVTKLLFEAGNILGIKMLDHVIFAKEKFFNFRDNCVHQMTEGEGR